MAGGRSSSKGNDDVNNSMNRGAGPSTKNYGLFLQEDALTNKRTDKSQTRDPPGMEIGFGRPPTGNVGRQSTLFGDGSSAGGRLKDISIDNSMMGGNVPPMKPLFKDDPLKP
jgi:hypothetical protein